MGWQELVNFGFPLSMRQNKAPEMLRGLDGQAAGDQLPVAVLGSNS
jgi:hypothetical protein